MRIRARASRSARGAFARARPPACDDHTLTSLSPFVGERMICSARAADTGFGTLGFMIMISTESNPYMCRILVQYSYDIYIYIYIYTYIYIYVLHILCIIIYIYICILHMYRVCCVSLRACIHSRTSDGGRGSRAAGKRDHRGRAVRPYIHIYIYIYICIMIIILILILIIILIMIVYIYIYIYKYLIL